MIVLDSSFLIGFHNERDGHHSAASAWMERFLSGEWGRGLLLEYVFLEVATVLLVRRDLEVASRVGRLLLNAEELDFVPNGENYSCKILTQILMLRSRARSGVVAGA